MTASTSLIAFLLSLLLSPSIIARLHLMLSVNDHHSKGSQKEYDFIIVLGYALFKDGTPTEPLKGRVETGVRLLNKGLAPRIILSGSHTCPEEGRRCDSEANAMLIYASKVLGVEMDSLDSKVWWKEEKSTSTRENAVYSLSLMEERGTDASILIVTSPFHQLRSLWTFQKAAKEAGREGLRVYIARTLFVPHQGFGPFHSREGYVSKLINASIDLWDLVREILAIAYYKYRGFI